MKLSALLIENFKGIKSETKVLIDNVVILIGPNNCCKSTILDAYEAYHSIGAGLSIDNFYNRNDRKPISITGVFTELTQEDEQSIGQEWHVHGDPTFGSCAKFKIVWTKAEQKGQKYSFSNITNEWKLGGAGGFDSILSSRLPTPIRINPTDSTDALEQIVKELISKNASASIKKDKSRISKIMDEINVLAKEAEQELSGDIGAINSGIQSEIDNLFKNVKVHFETGVGKFDPEKAIKEGSKFIFETNGAFSPLTNQGSGVQRSFLWAAVKTLCSHGLLKRGRTKISNNEPKVLLIDEPEINMHPSIVKAASQAIYSLAAVDGWQVICTTHSPVFIDLSENHTTLIKVSNISDEVLYYQTDKASFSTDEKENMKMLSRCCPTVNEFFFYDKAILVEGDTEYLAYQDQIERHGLNHTHCVINCRGKANIPTFIKIFNQFNAYAIAIHDLDTKYLESGRKNAMWTINERIREQADLTNGRVTTVVHIPDFEGYYLDESPQKDKPYNLFKHLTSKEFELDDKYTLLRNSLFNIEQGIHEGIYTDAAELEGFIESEYDEMDDFPQRQPCKTCRGRGGDITVECFNCGGTGYDPTDEKPFAQCHTCYGEKEVDLDECPDCLGSGYQ